LKRSYHKNCNRTTSLTRMATYSLRYFDARGVVENTRVMFAISGVEYEDFRYPINLDTYARPEFDAAAGNGDFVANMDRAPILIYNGTAIGQSKTIERFVAKKVGMFGSSDIEEAQIDMICEHIRDIKDKYNAAKQGKSGDELAEAKIKFIAEDLAKWFGKLEKVVQPDGFAVGGSISLADVSLHQVVVDYFDDKEGALAAVAACPNISAVVASVNAAARSWFETRPVTKM